jgi:hypothetical protein
MQRDSATGLKPEGLEPEAFAGLPRRSALQPHLREGGNLP